MPSRPLLLSFAAIAVLSLVARVLAASTFGIGFDEGMHMFVAKSLTLHQMYRELLGDTHPPLHYLLLRVLPGAEVSVLWPRLASIVPGVIAVVLVGCLACRLEIVRPVWWIGMVLLAVSHNDVSIGVSIRSYALANALVLLAVLAALELLRRPPNAMTCPWVVALLASTAACWSLYASVVALGAFALATVLAAPGRLPEVLRGLRRPLPLLSLAIAAATGWLLLAFCSRTVACGPLGHVQSDLRAAGEGFFPYAARGMTRALSQVTLAGVPGWLSLPAFGLLATWLGVSELRAKTANRARRVLALVPPLGYLVLAVLGAARLYPLGSGVRHQYPLFAFLVLWAMLACDRVWRRLVDRGARAAPAAALFGVLMLGVGAWTSWSSYRAGPVDDFGLPAWRWQADCNALRRELRPGDVLYLDQLETVAVYGSAWGQRWRLQRWLPNLRALFEVDGAEPPLRALRALLSWSLPPDLDAETLAGIAADMRAAGVGAVWALDFEWDPVPEGGAASHAPSPLSLERAGLRLERKIELPRGRAWRLRLLR